MKQAMKPAFFPSPSELRAWLERNHGQVQELWVGFYKKDSGRATITYQEALDEALCYGWIDGIRKALDEISYTIRFTPRKPDSIWSQVNIRRAGELQKLGRMQPRGLKAFTSRDEEKTKLYSYERETAQLDGLYEKTFRANKKAWEFFQAQPPGYRRIVSWYVLSAKKEETRQKRLAILIDHSGNGKRLPMLTSPTKAQGKSK